MANHDKWIELCTAVRMIYQSAVTSGTNANKDDASDIINSQLRNLVDRLVCSIQRTFTKELLSVTNQTLSKVTNENIHRCPFRTVKKVIGSFKFKISVFKLCAAKWDLKNFCCMRSLEKKNPRFCFLMIRDEVYLTNIINQDLSDLGKNPGFAMFFNNMERNLKSLYLENGAFYKKLI